jgi:hypothetical protein
MKEFNSIQPLQSSTEGIYSPYKAKVILEQVLEHLKSKLRDYQNQPYSKRYVIEEREKLISKLWDAYHCIIPLKYSDILRVLDTLMVDSLERDPEIGMFIIHLQVGLDTEKSALITLKSQHHEK